MSERTKNEGPYHQDQDGDTGIIGPGIHAEALDGVALVAALDSKIAEWVDSVGGTDDEASDAVDEVRDRVIALMNLAYARGAIDGLREKSR
jgi:hypothetical protein